MKYFLYILLTIAGCIAQPFTFQDLAFLGQETNAATAFSPSDVANLIAWYDANNIGSPYNVNGYQQTNWLDRSSAGNNLQNTAANRQPYYTNNGSQLGGKPWLKFDATDDYLIASTPVYAQPNTVFLVGKTGNASSDETFLDGTNSATRHYLNVASTEDTVMYAGTVITGPKVVASKWYLFECTYTNGASILATNGVQMISADGGVQPLSGITLGKRYAATYYYLGGGIAEVLIYNSNVSASDRTKIRTYFTDKYGAFSSW